LKENTPTLIIAEAGVNHNGSLDTARQLIDAAVDAGANVVKFQTFKAETTVSRQAPKAEYQTKTTDAAESQFNMIKKLELSEDMHVKLMDHCKEQGIVFLSSPFDLTSIDYLNRLGLNIFKIPSGEIVNLPYLRKLGALNKHVIMSTGMATLEEIETALKVLERAGTPCEKITILHCNTEYPTPVEDVNLKAMLTIRDQLGVKVGYSDHTLGIEVPIAAVAMGATIIEKHFTLDRALPGPDHRASLEPDELRAMVKAIRNIEQAMGDGIKEPSSSEKKNMPITRKSIVAAKNIKKGETLTEENLAAKRHGIGISPMRWDEVIGTVANKDYKADELIKK